MQKGFGAIPLIIGVLVFGLGVGAYFAYQNNFQNFRQINSFEDCAKYYPVMESYPEQCNTPDGKHFTKQSVNKEEEELVPIADESTNWKIYSSKILGVEFKYPAEFSVKESNNRNTSATTIQDTVRFTLEDKEFVFDKISSDGGVAPYQETDKVKVFNGLTWKVLEPDENAQYCDGGMCSKIAPSYYFFKSGYQYSFYYYSDDLKSTIESILESFKFLDQKVDNQKKVEESTDKVNLYPSEGKTWVEIDPLQCSENSWGEYWFKKYGNYGYSYQNGTTIIEHSEEEKVKEYFQTLGITIHDFEKLDRHIMVCAACSCPTGQTYYFLVDNKNISSMKSKGFKVSK